MVNKNDDLSFIVNEDGTETPIQVIQELKREEDGAEFVIYTDIEDPEKEDDREFYVAKLVTLQNGEKEFADVEDEKDLEFCQERFDEFIEQMMSGALSDDEDYDVYDSDVEDSDDADEENEEDTIVS